MRQTTLCLLIKEDKILLAMKKRGFGAGRWNGTGGKFNPEKDKNILDAAVRETKEEIGVDVVNLEKFGVFHFYFPFNPEWDCDVHLFLAKEWQGVPAESEEMASKWFGFHEIPYNEMWDSDKFWLPHILQGKKLEADFIFKKGDIIEKHKIRMLKG